MTATDLTELKRILPIFNGNESVLLLSPSIEQVEAFKEYFDDIMIFYREDWDIMKPCPLKKRDITFVANVLQYIAEPKVAIENLLKSCNALIIQDLIQRDRSSDGTEFGSDGDCMRFSYLLDEPVVDGYNLDYLYPVLYHSYMDNPNTRHFIMIIESYETRL